MIILDGTGPIDDRKYMREFRESHCNRLHRLCHRSKYFRGVPGETPQNINLTDMAMDVRRLTVTLALLKVDRHLMTKVPEAFSEVVLDLQRVENSGEVMVRTVAVSFDSEVRDQAEGGMTALGGGGHDAKGFKIFIAGHSRGGAAAIILAQMLQDLRIPVEAMFLFDAVNMTLREQEVTRVIASAAQFLASPSTSTIGDFANALGRNRDLNKVPSNVRHCYHAMRSPALARQILGQLHAAKRRDFELRVAKQLVGGWIGSSIRTREAQASQEVEKLSDKLDKTRSNPESLLYNWGNCATEPADKKATNFVSAPFMGSHGALGGNPWPRDLFSDDERISTEVWKWMDGNLRRHGVYQATR